MSDIFISYSRKNRSFVQHLVERLSTSARDIWVDWADIPWTADWWQEIQRGIEAAHSFIFVLSPASLSSLVCNLEIAHAIENQKRLIPIVLEAADAQQARETLEASELDDAALRILDGRSVSEIARHNWQFIAQHNWLFFNDEATFEQSFSNLNVALDTDLDYVHAHARLFVSAKDWENKQRERSFLLMGAGLDDAERWFALSGSKKPAPTLLHTEYIFESRRNANRQQRRLLAGVSTALIVTVVLGVLALFLWRQASLERDRANLQAQIAQSGRVALQGLLELDEERLDTALLLGVEAINIYDSREARSSLLSSLQNIPRLDKFLFVGQAWLTAVTLSPDEERFVTADESGSLLFWDALSGQRLGEIPNAHPDGVWDVTFSHDGSLLASSGADGVIRLWDAASREPVGTFEGDYEGEVLTIAFSPDDTLLASGHDDFIARLWNIDGREELASTEYHTDWISKVAFSPNGETLAIGSLDTTISLWDVTTPDEPSLNATLTGHTNWVFDLDFSPDGAILASASADGSVRLWDALSGDALGRAINDHLDWVRAVQFSADGRLLASASEDGSIILRDPGNGRRLRDAPPLIGHGSSIFDLAISSDAERMISVDDYGHILMWRVWEQQPLSRVFAEQPGEIYSITYSGDGTQIAAGSTEGTVVLWDVASGQPIFDPLTAASEVVTVGLSADGRVLAYGAADGSVELHSAVDGTLLHTLPAHQGAVRQVAISPDSTSIITVGDDGAARLWDLASGTLQAELPLENTVPLWSAAFSRDGQLLALGDESGSISLWLVGQRKLHARLPQQHTEGVTSLEFSPTGDTLASGSRDSTLVLWDVALAAAIGLPLSEHTNWVLDVTFSPDGRTLVTSSRDNTILLWDVATHRSIGQPFEGHTNWVWSVAFSPDGKSLASASRDSTIRLWDVDIMSWITRACSVANRQLNPAEIEQYLEGLIVRGEVCPDIAEG